MGLFSTRVLWNGALRSVVFWIIVVGTVYAASLVVPFLNIALIAKTMSLAFQGHLEGLSSQPFAFALAALISFTGLGFAAAYLLMHVLLIRAALADARRQITKHKTSTDFADRFDVVHKRLSRHPLIGHAWRAFDQTTFRKADSGEIQTTARPGTLINIGNARERLAGLKMMGSVPGYFVGVGLFLTFIGLVLALYQASAAVNSSNADGMQIATRKLLEVATFKFATSIAGLGSSILLSIMFRIYTVSIESAFDRFIHALEDRLRFVSSQSISWNMSESLAAQLTELKQINSADFFARMGENISPQIQTAFASAMVPVTSSINAAVDRLAQSSQTGVADLVDQFTNTLHVGAGEELRQLTATLQEMGSSLAATQNGIGRTGEDFGRRMSEAAENLSRLVADAGRRMDESSELNRAGLTEVVAALRETFERANQTMDRQLNESVMGASGKIEEAMSRVMGKLETQVGQFRDGLGSFHEGMTRQLTETNSQVSLAHKVAIDAVTTSSTEAANALRTGLAGALQSIRADLDGFTNTVRDVELAISAQVGALRDATDQTRRAADAFGGTAQDVRSATGPLLQSGERIASATLGMSSAVTSASDRISGTIVDANTRLAESISRSVASFEGGQQAAAEVAASIRGHIDQLAATWAAYSEKFERVDEDLGAAIDDLSEAVTTQGEQLAKFASQVDEGFSKAISNLNPFLEDLKSNTDDLGDAVVDLKTAFVQQAAE
jgi:uncharacterized protein YukE/gas vesicle protein